MLWRARWLGTVVAALALGAAGDAKVPGLTPTIIAAPPAMQTSPGDLVFVPPTGYAQERKGDVILLVPATVDDRTPCIYGLAGQQPSSGNLETDAAAALVNVVVPGWRRLDERYVATRG